MKVKELIEELSKHGADDDVLLVHQSHDYRRTMLAGMVKHVSSGGVKWSDYHEQWSVAHEHDLCDEDGKILPDEELKEEGFKLGVVLITFSRGQ